MTCRTWNTAAGWMAAFALAWVPALLSGQMRVYSDDDDDYSYASREGLEFGVNIGVYRGFPQAAYFYDGAGDHELSDVGAQIWGIRERLQQLQGQQLTHPVTGILNEFPAWNIYSLPLMQYKPSMFFGLKAAKFWNPETAVVCHVDVAQVTAEGSWSLSTGLLPDQGQGNEDVRTFPIIGKEQRLNIALGYRTSIYIAEGASWAFELGGLANAVAIEENYIVMSPNVGNALYEVNLLTAIGNGAGGQLSPASNVLTQWGTGFYSSLGLAVEFEEGGHVELNVRASRDNINLGTEAYKGWNVAAFLTWMIPSQLGDFVRASF
ncbi:MAG: hypothetical protein VXZ28_06335 [Bacteroidota bacterium]|nr:hypothetical protein [Flavobacteriales bacterium]MEC7478163.1 hypothetical protein [Bacteroidota bacterium]MEC8361862.1 hypothetical protein [Bacteroidota bacterium]MEC8400936.1 hypothetical protein [Bacteroidota bacterium]